jgi:hypothetical protein
VSVLFEDGDDVVGVVMGFKIDDQCGVAVGTKGGGGEESAFETMGRILAQDAAGRPGSVSEMVRLAIKVALDSERVFEAAKLTEFGGSEALRVAHQNRV